jgi:hypothetical protein
MIESAQLSVALNGSWQNCIDSPHEYTIAGTIDYASPEQMGRLPGVAVGPHSDVYGFARTCYFALLGTPEPDDVERDTLDQGWRKLLSQCTARKLENRIKDFASVLARLEEIEHPAAAPAPRSELTRAPAGRGARRALLRPREAPAFDLAAITTDLGQETFYRRLIALLVIVGFLAFCIGVSIEVFRNGILARRGFSALSGQRLSLVLVTLENAIPVASKRRRWTYLYDVGDRQEQTFVELASSTKPLFATPDRKQALAVVGPDGGAPLLLDAALSALDLTETERAAFYEACRATFGSETAR